MDHTGRHGLSWQSKSRWDKRRSDDPDRRARPADLRMARLGGVALAKGVRVNTKSIVPHIGA